MLLLKNLPIRKKLIAIILGVCFMVLAVGLTLVVLYEARALRVKLMNDMRSQARLIGEICVDSLRSEDQAAVHAILSRLRSQPDIVSAGVYNAQGEFVAQYNRTLEPIVPMLQDLEEGTRFVGNFLHVVQPIQWGNSPLGSVYFRVSTQELQSRVVSYVVTMLMVMVGLLTLAYFLGQSLQNIISRPILGLVGATRNLAGTQAAKDRVRKKVRDEVGILRDRLDFVLEQIQLQGVSLHKEVAMKQQLADLRTHEEKYREVVENMNYGLAILEAVDDGDDFIIKDFNKAGELMEHIHRADLVGMRVSEVFPGVKIHGLLETFRKVWKSGEAEQHPFSQFRDEKKAGWRENFIFKLPSGDIVTVIKDVKERKQKKKAKEELKAAREEVKPKIVLKAPEPLSVDRELEAMFFSIAHDLRAPLENIDKFSKSFLEDYSENLDDQGKNCMIQIRAASHRMAQLFNYFAQLSQISSEEMRLEEVDLSALVHKKAIALKEGSPERKVEFVIQEGITVKGDVRLLGIALDHLVTNAWIYAAKQPKAKIEFGVDHDNEYFVKDNGAGFDQSDSEKIFSPFQKLHSDETYPGTGMGLAIVRRIIHKHGGAVRAEGASGKGATFYFTL